MKGINDTDLSPKDLAGRPSAMYRGARESGGARVWAGLRVKTQVEEEQSAAEGVQGVL